MPKRVYIIDPDDILALSSTLQDTIIRANDIRHLPQSQQLLLSGSRLIQGPSNALRQNFLIRIFHVVSVQGRYFDRRNAGDFFVLLHIKLQHDDRQLLLQFAGGADLKIDMKSIYMELSDHDEPWQAKALPSHDDETY